MTGEQFLTPLAGFIYYEHLITLGREIELFWIQPASGATILFTANRYIFFLSNAFYLVQFTVGLSTSSVSIRNSVTDTALF